MKKAILILCALVFLLLFPVGIWVWFGSPFVDRGRITTTVTVYEGSVNAYDLNEMGRREFRSVINSGQKLVIVGRSGSAKGLGLASFNLLRPFIPKGVEVLRSQMKLLAQKMTTPETTSIFTEEAMNRYLVKQFAAKVTLSRAAISVTPAGFSGSGLLQTSTLDIDVSGSASFGIDRENDNQLLLKVSEIKIGPFRFPGFLLRQVEQAFAEIVSQTNFPVKILDIQYRNHAIFVKYRKAGA